MLTENKKENNKSRTTRGQGAAQFGSHKSVDDPSRESEQISQSSGDLGQYGQFYLQNDNNNNTSNNTDSPNIFQQPRNHIETLESKQNTRKNDRQNVQNYDGVESQQDDEIEMSYEQYKQFKTRGINQKENIIKIKQRRSYETMELNNYKNQQKQSKSKSVDNYKNLKKRVIDEKNADQDLDSKIHPTINSYQDQELKDKSQVEFEGLSDNMKNTNYKSRADEVFVDDDSVYKSEDSQHSHHHNNNRSSQINILRGQQSQLNQQLQKNNAMLQIEHQKAALATDAGEEVKPNARFKNFNNIFSGLTTSKNVATLDPIVSCIITYNSKSVLTVTKKNDRQYIIKQYNLEGFKMTFEEKLGGNQNDYIKAKDVEQNEKGDKFCVTYMNDGKFKIRVFGTETRTQEEIETDEFDINQQIDINDYTMPINNFPDPYIICTFINDDLIFVALFHNSSLVHHHFFYHVTERKITGYQQVKLDTNSKNFPFKCFYNADLNEVYLFYRQCESFKIPVFEIEHKMTKDKVEPFTFQSIYDRDMGQMFLINNQILIARCSSQILFFKQIEDEFTKELKWVNYHKLDKRGFIYFIKGNKRIQITTDDQVFFYLINPVTCMPELENVMYNFMKCSQMMFGSKVKYCVTFKTNEKSFTIYRRKQEHNFRSNIVKQNFDGSQGIYISDINAFLVSKIDQIIFYDVDTFKEIEEQSIKIDLLESTGREKNEIISMQISQNQMILAVISGKNMIMNEQFPNQLFIFKRSVSINQDETDSFKLSNRIVIKDKPEFKNICMQYVFQNTKNNKDPTTIIFANCNELIELNFETGQTKTLVTFDLTLARQPDIFLMNCQQTISIIASEFDAIYYNHKTKINVDLDELYQVTAIKEIIYDEEDHIFYIMYNKYKEKLGLFLIKFHEQDPSKHRFILRWKNKLDVSDASVDVVRNSGKKYKELVVSFKTIFINTFNVLIMDISKSNSKILFRHECFQLWESKISGFYLSKNRDFLTINKEGINIMCLNSHDQRTIFDSQNQEQMVHSLQSTNYLKIEASNFIVFEFATDTKIINVMQEYETENAKTGEETNFELIYKIKINDITLRELLLFQSLYVSRTLSDILKMVNDQPTPLVFYKSFLELDGTNMLSILSFDSRSVSSLLHESNKDYFHSECPMFYINKITKSNNNDRFFYRSAIDTALKSNQIRAVSSIIDYVCKYQNTYVSARLFQKNIPKFIQLGIEVHMLIKSNIFCYQFDYDEWPSIHTDKTEYIRPFNESIFKLRESYRKVFHETKFNVDNSEETVTDSSKVYKISYFINLLPSIEKYAIRDKQSGKIQYENDGISLMSIMNEADELDVFDSENFQMLIKFKWKTFAKDLHMRGCKWHFFYLLCMIIYIYEVYIKNDQDHKDYYALLLLFGVIYPTWYESLQFYKMDKIAYFKDNYSDIIYTLGSMINVGFQIFREPNEFKCKLLMTLLLIQQLIKSFFFLRIFRTLSYIVTMLNQVIYDLRVFFLFYFILILIFSMIFAVIGVGNENWPGKFATYSAQIKAGKHAGDYGDQKPGYEYEHIGKFVGYIISTLRLSIGDFDFDASYYLTQKENILYWIIWILTVVMTCIVFLNFIIAEASNSYSNVKERLSAIINKEKASLISEAETMVFESQKTEEWFPKYILKRNIEN